MSRYAEAGVRHEPDEEREGVDEEDAPIITNESAEPSG